MANQPLNIWHVGNWCVHTGQNYVESPFLSATKGVEVLNYAQQFVDAVKGIPGATVVSQPSWELYKDRKSTRLNSSHT